MGTETNDLEHITLRPLRVQNKVPELPDTVGGVTTTLG